MTVQGLLDSGMFTVIRMEPYKDPDEFIKNLGAGEFEKRIGGARNGFMFGLEVLEKDYQMDSPEGKTAFFQEAARRLTRFEDELERENYIEAVAKAYQVSAQSLQKLVTKEAVRTGMAKPVSRPKVAGEKKEEKEDGRKTAQKVLLTWMIDDARVFQLVRGIVTPEDFTESLYEAVARMLYGQYEDGNLNPARILNHFQEEGEHREVASLFHTRIRELTTGQEKERALKETIWRVKENSIDVRLKGLHPTDMAGLQRLTNEKRNLPEIEKLHISFD